MTASDRKIDCRRHEGRGVVELSKLAGQKTTLKCGGREAAAIDGLAACFSQPRRQRCHRIDGVCVEMTLTRLSVKREL